jgi:hypothetical protein
MGETEVQLKEIIIKKYGSLKKFCENIDMPWSTLDSILKRGVANSNITNVMKITKALGLDTESLATGKIQDAIYRDEPTTIAAHFDGTEFTEEELDEIRNFAEFVKNKRK